MSKNKLSFLFCLFVVIVVAIGCGGGSSDLVTGSQTVEKKPASYEIKNGKLIPTNGGIQGVEIDINNNTFKEGAVITIEENPFEGTRSSYLTNAPKTYRVSGVMQSTNPLAPSYSIDTVEEAVSITIPNSIKGDVEAYYFGVRASTNADWKFIRINEDTQSDNARLNVNMVRAALSKSSFTIKTNKLNIEFSLFANVRGSDKKMPSTVIDAINTVVAPSSSEKGKIPVKGDVYTDNMKVTVELGGQNINSLNLKDFIIELTFVNQDENIDKKLAGNGADYEKPTPAPWLAGDQNWSHSIIINDLKGSADKIQFEVNTKGMKTDEFPQNFSISIKSKNTANDVLPFDYENSVKVESKQQAPDAPTEITASSQRIKTGDSVVITWKPGESSEEGKTLENVTYTVSVAKNGGKEVIAANDLTKTEWTSDPLEKGAYTIKVAAVDKDGVKSEGEPITVDVIDSSLPLLTLKPLVKDVYKDGEPFEISWDEIKDPFDKPISYKVVLKSSIPENSKEIDVEGTSWTSSELPVDSYSIKVVASNGEESTESAPVSFQIKTGIPTAPLLNTIEPNIFRLGDMVLLKWSQSEDPFDKPITYDLYLYTGETAETPTASNLNATAWMSNTLATGTYSIKIVATNGTESNETIIPNAFTVMTSSRASIIAADGSVYSSQIYSTRPEFWVEISENNFDPAEVSNAVTVANVPESDVKKEWVDGKLKVSFNNDLTFGQYCEISMGAIKDKYDTEIAPFETKQFNVIPFPGKGTEAEPFVPGTTEANYLTNNGKLALISGLNTEVGCFKDMAFSNATINAEGSVVWSNLEVTNVSDNPVVEIPETELWQANKANMAVTMTFDGTVEGKTYKFVTNSKTYSTETGDKISVGDGSEAKPYLIYTPGQFDDLRNYCSGGSNFKQFRDINLDDYIASAYSSTDRFPRIGDSSNLFKGVYDGCNHVVKKLRMEQNNGDLALFYGLGTADTVVKNLGLEDVYICAKGPWVAAFAAQSADGSLINCYATGEIRSERSTTSTQTSGTSGGLVGRMYNGSIIGCHFSGSIFGSTEYYCYDVGGIVGRVENSNREVLIKDCYVEDSIITAGSETGGLIGDISSGLCIENCHVKNTTINCQQFVGGLVGNFANASVKNCSVENCTIEATSYIGGLIANMGNCDSSKDSIKNSHFTGSLKGSGMMIGGLIGYNQGMNLEDCYVDATNIEGFGDDIGGFAGYNYCNKCNNCWVKVATLKNNGSYTGGFIGNVCGGNYTDCYAIIESLEVNAQYAGLFAGYNSGMINNCHAEGSVFSHANVGGFVGYNGNTIEKCYSKASVTGTSANVGGFVGYNGYAINNCYCEGSVKNTEIVTSNMGGFVGTHYGSYAIITNCYSTCLVNEVGEVTNMGLLGGYMSSNSRFENSFTNVAPSAEISLFGLTNGGSTANSQSLPGGYDSSLGWDPEVWDLTKPLPTLL